MKGLDRDWLQEYPPRVLHALGRTAQRCNAEFFIAGGPVRDWLLGLLSHDLDITVSENALACAGFFAQDLGGTYVPLDVQEGVARVVWQGYSIDFSAFREGAQSLEDDLAKRDFTVNALGVAFDPKRPGLEEPFTIIDPTCGLDDLHQGVIRATSKNVFIQDPLRLLRAYRFASALGFTIDPATEAAIREKRGMLSRVSPERVSYELERIMESSDSFATFAKMAENGLLWVIFPELELGVGQDQPTSHHLDVFSHNLLTMQWMERLLKNPQEFFPGHGPALRTYCAEGRRGVLLKWAALFHDLGKPDTLEMRNERITFYNHDRAGAEKFKNISRRLRWSSEASKQVARFIALHMWPFHLNNAMRKAGISARACLRLVKAVGDELPGLFLLAMADSLAGQGPAKPSGMEESLARLYGRVEAVYQESIKPVLEQPRLLTGNDLIALLGLTPGPSFRKILDGLQKAQVEGEVKTRDQAVIWVKRYLEENEF